MFCIKCGTKLPEEAKFCFTCGTPIPTDNKPESLRSGGNTAVQTKLVPAQCTNCKAALEVNTAEKSAICPYCNSAYIVDEAIQNYNIHVKGGVSVGSATIHVSGANIENLMVRAKDFEDKLNYEDALAYYNRVLDMDFNHRKAHKGIQRVQEAIEDHNYFGTAASKGFASGSLQLKKGRIVFYSTKNKVSIFYLNKMTDLKQFYGRIQFEYPGSFFPVVFAVGWGLGQKWFEVIRDAQRGLYPERRA